MCNAVLSNIDDADAIQKFIFTTKYNIYYYCYY